MEAEELCTSILKTGVFYSIVKFHIWHIFELEEMIVVGFSISMYGGIYDIYE
jgi:hypothetical protein